MVIGLTLIALTVIVR
ncbi:hypothetical protein [Pantoea agglomerans]